MNVLDLPPGTVEDESVLFHPKIKGIKQLWHKKDRATFYWHRLRGPAVIHKNGTEEWYRYDEEYQPTAHELMMWELRKKNECS